MPPVYDATPNALLARLPVEHRAALLQAAQLARKRAARLWLVGGAVRDALCALPLGRDLDLAVEGDAPALARDLAHAIGGRLRAAHAAFGTATVEAPQSGRPPLILDLAAARIERYPRPGALPEVMPASIEVDLHRRDFSVNAMAMEVFVEQGQLHAGPILDPCGGRADLAADRLRLLHAQSLRDDPTRLLRGIRLAARLGLTPEPATAAQIDQAIAGDYLGLVSAERTLAELCLCLEERRPDQALRIADAWKLTPQVAPGLTWSESLAARAERLATTGTAKAPNGPLVWAGVLLYDLDPARLATLMARYPLPTEAARLLRELPALRTVAAQLTSDLPNSEIDRLLRPFSSVAVIVLRYAEPAATAITERYLRHLRHLRPPLDGNDLKRLGIAPGPLLGQTLDALRAATLDGEVRTREEAESWVRQRLQESANRRSSDV